MTEEEHKRGDGLVIGGPCHGQQIDPREGLYIRRPVVAPLADFLHAYDSHYDQVPKPEPSKFFEYKQHTFGSMNRTHHIYLPKHVPDEAAMAYLINMALRAPDGG